MSKARLSYLEAGLREIETAMGTWKGDPFDAASARITGGPKQQIARAPAQDATEEKVRRKPGPKPKPKEGE